MVLLSPHALVGDKEAGLCHQLEELYQLISNRGQRGQASQTTWPASLGFLWPTHSGAATLTENDRADPSFPEGVPLLTSLEHVYTEREQDSVWMFSFYNSAKRVLSLGYQHTAQVLMLRIIWRKSAQWTALLSTRGTFGFSGSNVAPDFLKCQMSSEAISPNLKPNTKKPWVCYCGILNKRNLALKTKWGICLVEFMLEECPAWAVCYLVF